MYRLTKESTLTVYGIKDTECSRLYNDLLAGYVKNPDPAQELDIMACIVYELGSIADDVTGLDYYPFFQTKCRQWINELDTDGRWEGISQETAVRPDWPCYKTTVAYSGMTVSMIRFCRHTIITANSSPCL